MKLNLKLIFSAIFAFLFVFLSSRDTFASEGVIELKNTTAGPSRCFATSALLPDFNYNVLITCRDLIYPVSSEVLTYIVWANPVQGSAAIKLGELNFGKVLFKTKTAFSGLFITEERDDNKNVKSPSGKVAMQGNVESILFLEDPTKTNTISEPIPEFLETPSTTANKGSFSFLRVGGFVTIAAIFIIILMLILVKPFK